MPSDELSRLPAATRRAYGAMDEDSGSTPGLLAVNSRRTPAPCCRQPPAWSPATAETSRFFALLERLQTENRRANLPQFYVISMCHTVSDLLEVMHCCERSPALVRPENGHPHQLLGGAHCSKRWTRSASAPRK